MGWYEDGSLDRVPEATRNNPHDTGGSAAPFASSNGKSLDIT